MRFGGSRYICHWIIISRSQKLPDLRSTQAETHILYYRLWETIDKAWIVIRQNFKFQMEKRQGHSSKMGQEVTRSFFLN